MKLAFVFPGQGSQSIGMLDAVAAQFPLVRETCDEASVVLGYDLWQLISQGPVESLNQTEITQPALLAASVGLWRVWQQQQGPLPAIMAGHSLGEYSALVCAGVMSFADGLRLVQLRGRAMQAAVPAGTGAMAAILGLEDAQVVALCETASQTDALVSAVNFNSPGQVVIAGHLAGVERAMEAAKAAGAKRALPLPVSVPSHCQLMQPAAEQLAQALKSLKLDEPRIPVLNNVDVLAPSDPEQIREALVRQLYCPVRWTETIEAMTSQEVSHYAECGPGKVLAGLIKRIQRNATLINLIEPAALQHPLE